VGWGCFRSSGDSRLRRDPKAVEGYSTPKCSPLARSDMDCCSPLQLFRTPAGGIPSCARKGREGASMPLWSRMELWVFRRNSSPTRKDLQAGDHPKSIGSEPAIVGFRFTFLPCDRRDPWATQFPLPSELEEASSAGWFKPTSSPATAGANCRSRAHPIIPSRARRASGS
jgi:hypothetical protein